VNSLGADLKTECISLPPSAELGRRPAIMSSSDGIQGWKWIMLLLAAANLLFAVLLSAAGTGTITSFYGGSPSIALRELDMLHVSTSSFAE
jgi:hypothetical protein